MTYNSGREKIEFGFGKVVPGKIAAAPGRKIKQARGQKTYDALVATGFKLLEQKEFEDISVAELARSAGYSVGAFYARFRSKDEFFDAMIAEHLEFRSRAQRKLLGQALEATLIHELVKNIVTYYWKRRRFWREAIKRSTRDPDFWRPIRASAEDLSSRFIQRVAEKRGRKLSKTEQTNVQFAFQTMFGTINNAIINRPRPVFIGRTIFVQNLERAFRLISDYDRLIARNRKRRRKKQYN